jgi:hypothetical protein
LFNEKRDKETAAAIQVSGLLLKIITQRFKCSICRSSSPLKNYTTHYNTLTCSTCRPIMCQQHPTLRVTHTNNYFITKIITPLWPIMHYNTPMLIDDHVYGTQHPQTPHHVNYPEITSKHHSKGQQLS